MIVTESLLQSDHSKFYHIPENCFYCSKKLSDLPLVMWAAVDGQIWLHAECAKTLGVKFVNEGSEAYEKSR